MAASADSVFIRVCAGDQLVKTVTRKLPADRTYALSASRKPGLIRYRVEFGATHGSREVVLRTVTNPVSGDAYLIDGQSNADAVACGDGGFPYNNDWIRSYGSTERGSEGARLKLCGNAPARAPGGKLRIGYWGMALARRLPRPPAGYAEMARLVCSLVEWDNYGRVFPRTVAPADLKKAAYTNQKQDEISTESDQPTTWSSTLSSQGEPGNVISGRANSNVITLKLATPTAARQVSTM